ncbi:MAG: hypothetical protein ABSH16_01980 [Sedimentisphaerales bacterium]
MTNDKTGRDKLEKIAFAVVLVISLVAAQAIVNLRSLIRLSDPVELSKSGLSVSMPRGSAWHSDDKWKFDGDGFTINSIFTTGANTGRSYARCRYVLAAKQMTAQERFSEYASSLNSETVETGQLAVKGLVVDWAKISDANEQASSVPFEIMFGVCRLPEGRYLEIEVLTTEDEKDLAQNIFNVIIKSIRFSDNGLLKAGIQIVGDCRNEGLAKALNGREKQVSLFMLTDASNRPVGFTMDAFAAEPNTDTQRSAKSGGVSASEVEPASESEVEAASYFYKRGRVPEEEVGLLHTDDTFTTFTWRVENRTGARARRLEMSAQDQNLAIQEQGKEKEYTLSKAAVPEIIADQVLRTFLDSNQNSILIDVIRADGTISPLYAEKAEPAQDANQVIKVELLDGRGIRQQIYYDSSKNEIKTVFEQGGVLTRSTAEEIAKLFPERANLVLNRNQLLNRREL